MILDKAYHEARSCLQFVARLRSNDQYVRNIMFNKQEKAEKLGEPSTLTICDFH